MRERACFVSNSSSSSFCIFGAYKGDIDPKLLQALNLPIGGEYNTQFSKLAETLGDMDSRFEYHYMDGCEYVGIAWPDIGDKETGEKFKQLIQTCIKAVVGHEIPCRTHAQAWFNG